MALNALICRAEVCSKKFCADFFAPFTFFYSLWAYFSLQYKVLHLFGNSTAMTRSRENLKISSVQYDTVIKQNIIKINKKH